MAVLRAPSVRGAGLAVATAARRNGRLGLVPPRLAAERLAGGIAVEQRLRFIRQRGRTVRIRNRPDAVEYRPRPIRRICHAQRRRQVRNVAVMPAHQNHLARVLRICQNVAGDFGIVAVGVLIVVGEIQRRR